MRPSCPDCARKHLAQAEVLAMEARQGYPKHIWKAIGHLAEAADELVQEWPAMANTVREQRKKLEASLAGHPDGSGYDLPIGDLIDQVGMLASTPTPPPVAAPFTRPKHPHLRYQSVAPVAASPAASAPSAPAAAAPTPCTGCEESKKFRTARALWATNEHVVHRILILVPLSDFNPAYSLVSVALDQARAAAMIPGAGVALLVSAGADLKLLPPLPPNVEVFAAMPRLVSATFEANAAHIKALDNWLKALLYGLKTAIVITHDLVFQDAFTSWAKMFHHLGDVPGIRFFHLMHSSVGARRKQEGDAVWQSNIPPGHSMLALNHSDLPYLARYFDAPAKRFKVLLNARDIRSSMTPHAAKLITDHQLLHADVVQLYPMSATRMQDKGINAVINIFKSLADAYATVRLVIADAHANGTAGKDQRTLARQYADSVGLPKECLVFVSEQIGVADPQVLAYGLDQRSIQDLFRVSNLFVFPTKSEAGSLVLLEAAQSGALLVLNSSLPCLKEYVPVAHALWRPFGSIKEPKGMWGAQETADSIAKELDANVVLRCKRAALRQASLETYRDAMITALGLGTPAG